MRVAAAQLAPVLLDREATLAKVVSACQAAQRQGARLLAFPEALVPGYPVWLARTHGSAFDDALQKRLHARYLDQAVELPGPVTERLAELSSDLGLSLVLGCMERGTAEARGSLYCTALWMHPGGRWLAHRKLVPTYEERLAWAPGDGHGLRVQTVEGWGVSALNCWENWMPAARFALYAQGAEVHVSLWPGSPANTRDISRFTAREGRVFVVAASGVVLPRELPWELPARDEVRASAAGQPLQSGGSRIVGPDGIELAALDEPVEGLLVADLDRELLLGERQNFDAAGHYHRKDVFQLHVNRARRAAVEFDE